MDDVKFYLNKDNSLLLSTQMSSVPMKNDTVILDDVAYIVPYRIWRYRYRQENPRPDTGFWIVYLTSTPNVQPETIPDC